MLMLLGAMLAYTINLTIANPVNSGENSDNEVPAYDFPFVKRADWNARIAKQASSRSEPVPYVVIHHSYIPAACYDNEQCKKAMQEMQNFHMDGHGWWDIGYNFGVGSNGKAYEGRGWKIIGAQALHFNSVSIGICLIGDWRNTVPPAEQLKTAQKLIEAGVSLGFIRPDYKLVGHRQVRATECPGDALFREIQSWNNYSPFPHSVDDLVYVEELPMALREELRLNATNALKVT